MTENPSYSTTLLLDHSKVLWKYGSGDRFSTIFILKVTPQHVRPNYP
jgi:hypothetical protein